MTWTDRTFHITVKEDDDSYRATERASTVTGTGDTPYSAISDFAEQCEEIVRDSMEADA